jgi:hypothetical protein
MKRILLSLVITLAACGAIAGQTGAELKEVTLYWYHTPGRFFPGLPAVNIKTGYRGPDHDVSLGLRYGGMVITTPTRPGEVSKILPDWLGVLDCRSMIVDLGRKQWQDFKETPPFPQPKKSEPPLSLNKRPCVVNTSAGRKDFSPYRQFVVVNPGHVYLMRLWRESKVSYVMFRVESLISWDNCVLSWKMVKPPNVDDEK